MLLTIVRGPHSPVRQFHLTANHMIFGGVLVFGLFFSAGIMVGSARTQAKDILYAMQKEQLPTQRVVADTENDYESKLIELQARLEESQRDLSQFDALRTELARNNDVGFGAARFPNYIAANNIIDLGNSQGGPNHAPTAIINLGNQGEQYGARLDRTVVDSINFSNRVKEAQQSLTNSWNVANAMPTGLPLELPSQVSSGLGYRLDPITKEPAWHDGTDYPAAFGTPILATADGYVIRAEMDAEYGNVVDIGHSNGYVTRYAHAQELLVKQGDHVLKSQVIAKVGSTGRSTGPHVHYEVLRDKIALSRK
jgi:murein DD-endopeptidase MepM/ murein hydrolase activator NlpD